jgi:excisionase family DNA binding protein
MSSMSSHTAGPGTQELLTPAELAKQLKVPMGTIYYWVSRREIPVLRLGRHLRFSLDEVMQYFIARSRDQSVACHAGFHRVPPTLLRSLKTKNSNHADLPEKE